MRGLPIVSTATGAIPEIVNGQSGVLVPIDDAAALAAALEPLITDDAARARLAAAARLRRLELPDWPESVRQMAVALARFRDHGVVRR
jgi:glycosyltransferase involved in cell wall biosynthesis